jgi:parvulin-like peptidyl-prolyl isomerase
MSALKIGDRQLNSEQIVSALVQYKLLEPLVGQVLLDQVIEQVPITEPELFRALGGEATELPEDLNAFVAEWCQQKAVAPAYFKGVILRELRVEKFKQLQFAHQIEAEFLRLKPEFDQVEFDLLQLPDQALAQELYFHLRDDGGDFERLAKRYGGQGRVEAIAMSALPAEVASFLRSCQPGVVSTPLPVGEKFWIVRLEKLTAARLTDAVRTSLMNGLYDRWLRTQVNQLMTQPGAIQMQSPAPSLENHDKI